MRRLAILRHAKSSWDRPQLDDFKRPLNSRGRSAARALGAELRSRERAFDAVVASPATRVRETLAELGDAYGRPLPVRFEPDLYMAGMARLLDCIRELPPTAHDALIVGHNPGLHQLVLDLTSDDPQGFRGTIKAKFPTAAFATVRLPVARWPDVATGLGTIEELILARGLT